jgi:hypothetical protein
MLLGWILFCIICMLLTSCKTKTVVVEKVVDRYTHTTDTIRDSIRNDVFVKEYVKGDTVFVDKLQTLYKYVYRAKTDTFIQKDSVHVKDSVFIHSKGDTVWYEKWHTKYVDRWNKRVVCDTLIKTDSIHVPYPVPAQLSRWQSFCCDYGKLMLGGTIMALILITTYL